MQITFVVVSYRTFVRVCSDADVLYVNEFSTHPENEFSGYVVHFIYALLLLALLMDIVVHTLVRLVKDNEVI